MPCVSSSVDVLPIMLTVHNPKNFPLVMPTSLAPAGIVEFKELSPQPTAGTDYDLEQTASGRLKLTYKKAFLQKYEQGSGSLNPTITLKAKDGRVFKKTYTFGIKSNTPPPKPKEIVIAKTKGSNPHYVLCLKFEPNEMTRKIGTGTVPVHKDIAKITINDSHYTLLYKEDNSDFKKPEGDSFVEHGNVEKLTSSSPDVPSGAWVLYYKTNIKIRAGNPETSYTITLHDKGGVTSDVAVKTIAASGPTHTVTFSVVNGVGGTLTATPEGGSENTTGSVLVEHGKNVTFNANPNEGYKVEKWTLNGSPVNGTNKTYTLSDVRDNKTVTVEFEKVTAVSGSNNFAWKLLKKAVEITDHNAVITIDGIIKATSGDNAGQIVIGTTLTIEGKNGAETDILDANKMSRIFKVENGKTLILKNLTLTGGKADREDEGKCGGAIFAQDANKIEIENCIITGNEADTNGGGLNVEGTPTTITNCTFTGNTAKNGGGIYIIETSNRRPVVTISGGTIGGTGTNEANEATGTGSDGNGGGIYVGNLCKVILQNNDSTGCTIKGNTAYTNGGGVYANNADVIMSGRTRIEVDNDVYLDDDSLIKVFNTLTASHPVARITVPKDNYNSGTQVLDGNAVGSQHTKFAVTPKDGGEWEVNRLGFLRPKY